MWEYLKENIGKGGVVAKYHNSQNMEVLHVLENENGGHFTNPHFTFINICNVSLEDEKNISMEKFTDSDEEIAEKRLKAACILIEADYISQPTVIDMKFV